MISTETPTPCQDNPVPFDAVLDRPSKANVEAAKRICQDCPHREPCVLHALSVKATGVYGGRLLLLDVKPPSSRAPRCTRCGEQRAPRGDRQGWKGGKGMCDRCYQAVWREAHGRSETRLNNRDGIDQAKVERAICGEPLLLNLSEREYAVGLLANRGLSDSQSAFLLRLDKRSVLRIRKRAGIPAVAS